MQIQISISDAEISGYLPLLNLERRLSNLTPALGNIGEYMMLKTRERFDAERSPEGTPWAALNPAYRAQKQRKGLNTGILKATLGLRDTINYRVEGDRAVLIGSDRQVNGFSLGAIHQFGATINRTIPVTAKMRKFFWANYYKTGDSRYKSNIPLTYWCRLILNS